MCQNRCLSRRFPHRYTNDRFLIGIISHGIGLYVRFWLSDRDAVALMPVTAPEGDVAAGDTRVKWGPHGCIA
jgi:hypothetical protein